jgi:hypothetical protein
VLEPNTTPISDLAFAPWACWHGAFGHVVRDRLFPQLSYYLDDAPLSPMWQAPNVEWQAPNVGACDHLLRPPARPAGGEEVLDNTTAATLRSWSGSLRGYFDGCPDWRQSPSAGVYVEACDPGLLRRYFTSGLTTMDSGGLRLVVDGHPTTAAVPVVYRDKHPKCFDRVDISAATNLSPEIYAGCTSGNTVSAACFRDAGVGPGRTLHLTRRSGVWALVGDDGRRHWRATPSSSPNGDKIPCVGPDS